MHWVWVYNSLPGILEALTLQVIKRYLHFSNYKAVHPTYPWVKESLREFPVCISCIEVRSSFYRILPDNSDTQSCQHRKESTWMTNSYGVHLLWDIFNTERIVTEILDVTATSCNKKCEINVKAETKN